jgi:hypothetical protein
LYSNQSYYVNIGHDDLIMQKTTCIYLSRRNEYTVALSNVLRMDLKCGHASIIGKKISSFTPAIMEIFNFFVGKMTYAPPCILNHIQITIKIYVH